MTFAKINEMLHPSIFNFNGRLLNILLIEDDDDMREMLTEAFRQEGWEVTECKEAYRWLQYCFYKSTCEFTQYDEFYDVVISDIRLPGMSGLDVMEKIKDYFLEKTSPPTILITAFGSEEVHRYAKELGAEAVINKPFDTEDLIAKIREVAL